MFFVSVLYCVLLTLLGAFCVRVRATRSNGVKVIHNNAAALLVQGPKGWLPADVSSLKLSFSPPLEQNVDFSIWAEPNKHVIPEHLQIRRNAPTILYVLLTPGKRWVKNLQSQNSTQELRLVRITNAAGTELTGYKRSSVEGGAGPDVVARIAPDSPPCPPSLVLPGASEELQHKVDQVLLHCQDPLFVDSRDLKWKHYRSMHLLLLQPAVMFVNGSDHGDMRRAAKSVDRFLAAHSVLDVVWEPMSEEEPQIWVLMPRALGMPGHLFAALDALQWRLPQATPSTTPLDPLAPAPLLARGGGGSKSCAHTQLAGITGSGYSADAFNVYNVLREAFMRNLPVQAFPSTLGKRSTPPFWDGVQGWTYAFEACKTNFLDCYFLDHSPCPKITHDVRGKLNTGENAVNRSRLVMPPAPPNLPMRPTWWGPLVGKASASVPERTIRDLGDGSIPSRMVFYSYFFRPNYFIRQKVEKMVREFQLIKKVGDIVATMHVRRGDVLLHTGQARFYIPLKTYVQGALPFIKSLGVTTILLLTDSQAVINEALACEKDFPEICRDLSWRFVEKKRWFGAEGGWENPFPSGSAVQEFANIQLEYALAQQGDLMIMGNSGYGDLAYNHMCCKFPLHTRGSLPQRCWCPPKVRLEQSGFTCKTGNKIMCGKEDRGGNVAKPLNDPANMRGANFSHTKDAFKEDVKVWVTTANDIKKRFMYEDFHSTFMLSDMTTEEKVKKLIVKLSQDAREQVCYSKLSDGPRRNIKNCA